MPGRVCSGLLSLSLVRRPPQVCVRLWMHGLHLSRVITLDFGPEGLPRDLKAPSACPCIMDDSCLVTLWLEYNEGMGLLCIGGKAAAFRWCTPREWTVSAHSPWKLAAELRNKGDLPINARPPGASNIKLLKSLDVDAFPLSFHQVIARCGTVFKLLCNNGGLWGHGASAADLSFRFHPMCIAIRCVPIRFLNLPKHLYQRTGWNWQLNNSTAKYFLE